MSEIASIDLSEELLKRQRGALRMLHLLSVRIDPAHWTVVGGLMVLIVGREFGHRSTRAEATKDVDVLVDIVANERSLAQVVHELQEGQGFRLLDPIGDEHRAARCTLASGSVQVDVLCPDDALTTHLEIPGGAKSVAIPGGRRALETARFVDLYFSEDYVDVRVRVPSVAGAIVAKAAAAVDERTAGGSRHIQDVAFLLSLPLDVVQVAGALTDADRALLRAVEPRLVDHADVAWAHLSARERSNALGALRFLVG